MADYPTMSCGCSKDNVVPDTSGTMSVLHPDILRNFHEAYKTQQSVIRWIINGTKKILKCLGQPDNYTEEQIVANRSACESCEFSTRKQGRLFKYSQCMATDPKTGSVCGCFIMCRTQTGPDCPLGKWVDLTINKI